MSRISQGVYAGATAEMVENLRDEFIQEASDELRALAHALAPSTDLKALRQFTFRAVAQSHSFDMALFESVAQRLSNFLSAVTQLSLDTVADLRAYLDALSDILDGTIPTDADTAQVVRELPARPPLFDVASVDSRDVEVMLVMLHNAQTRFVEREMHACGYRVTVVTSTLTALQESVRTKPDMVIISAVMPGLSGIDLACALAAMPESRNTPVALITSLDNDDPSLALVPKSVPIIHKTDQFGDDLAAALSFHFLL